MKELALRDYQDEMITGLALNYGRGHLRQMLYAPTGSGKTETAVGIIQRIWAAGKILPEGTRPYFIVDRTTLCQQAKERFESYGLKVGILQAENTYRTYDEDVVVASIHTIASRHKQTLPQDFGMGIIDEAHLLFNMHERLMDELNALMFVGLSATPLRASLGNYYTAMVEGPDIKSCIKRGWLVPAKCYGPQEPDLSEVSRTGSGDSTDYNQAELGSAMQQITGDVIETWKEKGENRQTICFAVNIAHGDEIAEQFRMEGISAESVNYKMTPEDVNAAKDSFAAGDTTVLVTVMKLAIGFDAPNASCAILARPTLSEALHLQQIGRVLRPFKGKENALVLDHAGNLARFGRPEDFMLPPLDVQDLEDRAKKNRTKKSSELVPCPECFAMMEPFCFECPECGHTRKRPSNIVVVDGKLVDLDTPEGLAAQTEADSAEAHNRFYRDLLFIASEKGYAQGWAFHQYKSRYNAYPRYKKWELDDLVLEEPLPSSRRWVSNQNKRHQIAMRKKKASG